MDVKACHHSTEVEHEMMAHVEAIELWMGLTK